MDLLKAPTIDRAAIEGLRSQQMAVADAISKRVSTAFADTAEVLTPEQRVKLAERMQSHRGHGAADAGGVESTRLAWAARILLIDDDKRLADMVGRYLSQAGFE